MVEYIEDNSKYIMTFLAITNAVTPFVFYYWGKKDREKEKNDDEQVRKQESAERRFGFLNDLLIEAQRNIDVAVEADRRLRQTKSGRIDFEGFYVGNMEKFESIQNGMFKFGNTKNRKEFNDYANAIKKYQKKQTVVSDVRGTRAIPDSYPNFDLIKCGELISTCRFFKNFIDKAIANDNNFNFES